jgi:hypothetical protein
MSHIEASMYLHEAYDMDYGIYNHGADSPYSLSIVCKHPNEDIYVKGEPLKVRISNYLATGIKDLTGINFVDWVNLTRYQQNTIIEACAEFKSTELAKQQRDVDELEKLTKSM